MVRKTPVGASTALETGDTRLFAPAADRNRNAIAELIGQIAPKTGSGLEIASGTGQHVVTFAEVCPGLRWQPTDVSTDRIASIDAYATESGLGNISKAFFLDATQSGWAKSQPEWDFIFLANLLHLISSQEAENLVAESAAALAQGGAFLIYGPFKRGDQLTSPGDQAFHDSLVAQDPEIGYKDLERVITWAAASGLAHLATHEMPANNLALEFRKPF